MRSNFYFGAVESMLLQLQQRVTALWFKYEKQVFYSLLLINLLPVFSVAYFFTGDGPAHLYNANIILHLLRSDDTAFADFFVLRNELVPNVGGHILLTFFQLFLSAAWAEKMVFGLCLLSLPLAFRYALRQFHHDSTAFALLIFPMAHNFCFYIGFQSFCLGLAMMFYAVGYFIRIYIRGRNYEYVLLGLLLFLTAVFHLFTALAAMVIIGLFITLRLFYHRRINESMIKTVAATLPMIIFCGIFLVKNSGSTAWKMPDFALQLKSLWQAAPIITIDTAEKIITVPLNILLVAGVLLIITHRIKRKQLANTSDFALFSALVFLVCFFVLPDKMASGGFVSIRMLLSFFLMIAFWLALSFKRSGIFVLVSGGVVLINIASVYYHVRESRKLSADAAIIHDATDYIPSRSTVIPINYSGHWMHYNIGLYLGTSKELVVLDNYEASTTHFPVKWNTTFFPGDRLGNFTTSNRPLLHIEPYEKETGKNIDAVVRWRYNPAFTDSSTQLTNQLLAEKFTLVHHTDQIEVHLRKTHSR